VIEVRQLTKTYGPTVAVDELTFTVRPGRVTGFLGPNGAGKSTTMRLILGLDRPLRGEALVTGRPYQELREPLRHVGALLEAKSVHGGRTAHDHLLWLAQTNRIGRRRVREVLGMVGLEAAANKRVGGFSLGMGQRLGLAAALLGDPPILLLDEPVNGLDPQGVRWMRTLLKTLAAEGRTVFVSSHLMSEMALTADHLVVIGRGRLIADTDTEDFIARTSRAQVLVRTREPDRLHDLLVAEGLTVHRDTDGSLSVEGTDTSTVGQVAATGGVTLDELSTRSASLEDAFLQLTADAAEYRASTEQGADNA
jgi:ABC-2 type transport system ATP-binding protein